MLRLKVGDAVELFDDQGAMARATVVSCQPLLVVQVEKLEAATQSSELIVASALPKGARCDWMIEKLSELGVARFVPLRTARSVVLPEGKSKAQRWQRLAVESAKQSRRAGVMQIDELTDLPQALAVAPHRIYLSPDPGAPPLAGAPLQWPLMLLVGPEGGWTAEEIELFRGKDAMSARLTDTILRTETAAVAGAVVVASQRLANR